jgi:hypothetical protein
LQSVKNVPLVQLQVNSFKSSVLSKFVLGRKLDLGIEASILDQTQPVTAPQKPSLYFLKGNHGVDVAVGRSPGQVSPAETYYQLTH